MINAGTKIEARVLKLRHPQYLSRLEQLYFLRTTFAGNGPYAPHMGKVTLADLTPSDDVSTTLNYDVRREVALWRHPREKAKFDRRVLQAYNVNIFRRGISLLSGFLTRQSPQRDEIGDRIMEWTGSVTTQGETLDAFISRILPELLVYGWYPLLVHRPPSRALTRAQQMDEGAEVVVSPICPETIVDWLDDGRGGYEWLHYVEQVDLAPDPLATLGTNNTTAHEEVQRHWYLTQEGWWYVDERKGDTECVVEPDALGTWEDGMPLVMWRVKTSELALNAAPLQRELYNVLSLEQEQERETAFAMLVVPQVGGQAPKLMSTGSDNALVLPPQQHAITPFWLVSDTAALDHYEKKIARLVKDILCEMSLDFDEGATTGVAQSFKMSKVQRLLVGLSSDMAANERNLLRMAGHVLGEELSADARSVWPRRFDEADLEREIAAITAVLQLEIGPTLSAECRYRAAKSVLQDLDEKTLEKGWDEIEGLAEAEAAEPEETMPIDEIGQPQQSGMMQSAEQQGNMPEPVESR